MKLYLPLKKGPISFHFFCFFLIKNLAEISKFFFVVFLSYSERTLRYVFGEEMKKQELKVL